MRQAARAVEASAEVRNRPATDRTTSKSPRTRSSTRARLWLSSRRPGAITIGTKFDQPLFGLLGPDNVPVGFDVAIGALVASKLGIPFDGIDWTETVSSNRIPFIETDQVDIVVATFTINDDRKIQIDMAGPYFVAGQSIMVLEGNEDIQGRRISRVSRCARLRARRRLPTSSTQYGADLKAAAAYSDCLEPLRQGTVVALTTDNVILSGYIDQNPGEFKMVGDTFTEEPYGIGLTLGDTDFRMWINDVLEEAFEDGTWARLFEETAGAVLDVPDPPAGRPLLNHRSDSGGSVFFFGSRSPPILMPEGGRPRTRSSRTSTCTGSGSATRCACS